MKHYIVVESNITDPSWISNYVEQVSPMVARHGGKYLARSQQAEVIEGPGEAPHVAIVAEFPSREAALGFYNSAEYQPYKEARQAGSTGRFLMIPAEGATS